MAVTGLKAGFSLLAPENDVNVFGNELSSVDERRLVGGRRLRRRES
jgi:hypothetical protein